MERLTRRDIEDYLTKQAPDDTMYVEEAMRLIDRWLDRGDGVAVYRNEDLDDHTWLGHMKFVSYGSEQAQLEVDEPPTRLPDIGSDINWRYQLVGVYKSNAPSIEEVRSIFAVEFEPGEGPDVS
jgi:hypothetical protein